MRSNRWGHQSTGPDRQGPSLPQAEATSSDDDVHLAWRLAVGPPACVFYEFEHFVDPWSSLSTGWIPQGGSPRPDPSSSSSHRPLSLSLRFSLPTALCRIKVVSETVGFFLEVNPVVVFFLPFTRSLDCSSATSTGEPSRRGRPCVHARVEGGCSTPPQPRSPGAWLSPVARSSAVAPPQQPRCPRARTLPSTPPHVRAPTRPRFLAPVPSHAPAPSPSRPTSPAPKKRQEGLSQIYIKWKVRRQITGAYPYKTRTRLAEQKEGQSYPRPLNPYKPGGA
ncbi:hypothetical protein Taro_046007 [Colocasia esculenta]|uniref:Uncharacterized protein n=1 Tax=Colocasia esculenta TaxID=4460 RepID=A0A843X512_COLES|nr:hypothetical protein [Colocasia esculenta]